MCVRLAHLCQLILVVENVYKTEDKDTDHVYGERYEEHEEVSVVPPSYAVVDPGTVVVEYLDAVVADTAVTAPMLTMRKEKGAYNYVLVVA